MILTVVIVALVLVVVMPVGFLMTTTIAAAALGTLLTDHAAEANADSELLDTNY